MSDFFTPAQIAALVGLSVQTVRTYLRERFPKHEYETWWRLSEDEYAVVLDELRTARYLMPLQPLRLIRQVQARREQAKSDGQALLFVL